LAAVPSIGRAANVEAGAGADGAVALEGLYERHSQRVFRYCLAYLRKRDEAEDAAQTTFLHALRALRRGVVPNSESAWLLKIARNVCLTRFDSVKRRGNLELIQDPHVLAETATARPGANMDLLGLQAALERLPKRQRQAILLREWQGLSYAEIATELGLSTSAVETLIFRARRSLARELAGEEKRRGLDLAGLLGWAKALFGGTAGKIAVGAAVVATMGVVGPLAEHPSHDGSLPARQPLAMPLQGQAQHAGAGLAAAAPARADGRAQPTLRTARTTAAKLSTGASAPAPRRVAPGAPPSSAPSAPPAPHGTVAPSTPAVDPAAPPHAPRAIPAVPVSAPQLPDPTQTVTLPVPVPVPVPVPDPVTVPTVPDLPDVPPVADVPAPALPPLPPTPTTPSVPQLPPAPSLPPAPDSSTLPKLP
jgi:RNA polymerase sigma factor (sigma-70 family)